MQATPPWPWTSPASRPGASPVRRLLSHSVPGSAWTVMSVVPARSRSVSSPGLWPDTDSRLKGKIMCDSLTNDTSRQAIITPVDMRRKYCAR